VGQHDRRELGRARRSDLGRCEVVGPPEVFPFFVFSFSFLFIFFSHFRFRILNLNSVVNLHIYQVFQFKSCDKNIYLFVYLLSFPFLDYFSFQIFKLVINSQLWI
jgi:hypothetical protein